MNTVRSGGKINSFNGIVTTQQEAKDLISAAGGIIERAEEAHYIGGPSPHLYPHINYTSQLGIKGTIQIKEVIQ